MSSPNNNNNRKKEKISAKNLGNYILVKNMIGKGAYAEVYEGFRKEDKVPVAIKVIPRSKLNDKLMSSLEQEIHIMKRICHDNIIRLFDVHRSKRHFYLVMEKCTGGDLSKYMKNERKPLQEHVAHKFLTDLAYGLKILNTMNLVHRDLKPANLMLSTKSTEHELGILKIADFGFAREIQPNDMAETLCGSPLYMAPEILEAKKYDAKADLWSVGTILYEMLFGRPPYLAASMQDLLRTIKTTTLKYPVGVVSPAAIHLLQGLLQPDPDRRMSFDQFFNHPYLNLKAQPDYEARSCMNLVSTPSSPSSAQESFATSNTDNTTTNDSVPSVDYNSQKSEDVGQNNPSDIQTHSITQQLTSQSSATTTTTTTGKPSQPKINPFIGGTYSENHASSTSSSTDPVEKSYVVIQPNVKAAKSLDSCIAMTSSGKVQYPDVIFDFSKLKCQHSNIQEITDIEQASKRAWAIAEAAYLHETFNKPIESIALYSKALDLLFNQLARIQQLSPNLQQSASDRLAADMLWMQTQFDDILERADRLKGRVVAHLNNGVGYVCAEDILYHYGLKLAKESAFLEWSDRTQPELCANMYKRSKYVFEYLLHHCEYLTNRADQQVLQEYIEQFQNRIIALRS